MKLKPLRQATIIVLTLGASLTLGLLSFTGMFVIWPVLPLALISFTLAVAYEGEIFWQNLKGAFKNLLSPFSLKRQLARELILKKYNQLSANTKDLNNEDADLYTEITEYIQLLTQLEKLEHDVNTQEAINQKKNLKRKIKHYEIALAQEQISTSSEFKKAYYKRYFLFTLGKIFSLIAGAFVGMGTAYLLFEAFITLPFLAAVPISILPTLILAMAGVSAIAYALICYHSITSMINDNAVGNFIESIKNEFKKGLSLKLALKLSSALLFTGLTITLTVCTAGTWWTIAQDLSFVFSARSINVAVCFIGLSTFFVNFYNTICTWFGLKEQISAMRNAKADNIKIDFPKNLEPTIKKSNALNWNPAGWVLKIIMTPIDWTLFVAHVISIGVTGDQIPGISKFTSTVLCSIDEFKEDWHRFFGHEHEHTPQDHKTRLENRTRMGNGHQHSLDLPRKFIQFTLLPLYILASLWDTVCIKNDNNKDTWTRAWQQGWNRQWGQQNHTECAHNAHYESCNMPTLVLVPETPQINAKIAKMANTCGLSFFTPQDQNVDLNNRTTLTP